MSGSMEFEDKEPNFQWGQKTGDGSEKDVHFYHSFIYDDMEYSLYDCVYLFKNDEIEPYIGKIVRIWKEPDGKKKVMILWFFRPSEIKSYLGDDEVSENEIFLASGEGVGLSNVNPLEAIAGKCFVVCTSKDTRNVQPSREELEMADYIFCRTFDVGSYTISKKMADAIAGIEVKYLLNQPDRLELNSEFNHEANVTEDKSGTKGTAVFNVSKPGSLGLVENTEKDEKFEQVPTSKTGIIERKHLNEGKHPCDVNLVSKPKHYWINAGEKESENAASHAEENSKSLKNKTVTNVNDDRFSKKMRVSDGSVRLPDDLQIKNAVCKRKQTKDSDEDDIGNNYARMPKESSDVMVKLGEAKMSPFFTIEKEKLSSAVSLKNDSNFYDKTAEVIRRPDAAGYLKLTSESNDEANVTEAELKTNEAAVLIDVSKPGSLGLLENQVKNAKFEQVTCPISRSDFTERKHLSEEKHPCDEKLDSELKRHWINVGEFKHAEENSKSLKKRAVTNLYDDRPSKKMRVSDGSVRLPNDLQRMNATTKRRQILDSDDDDIGKDYAWLHKESSNETVRLGKEKMSLAVSVKNDSKIYDKIVEVTRRPDAPQSGGAGEGGCKGVKKSEEIEVNSVLKLISPSRVISSKKRAVTNLYDDRSSKKMRVSDGSVRLPNDLQRMNVTTKRRQILDSDDDDIGKDYAWLHKESSNETVRLGKEKMSLAVSVKNDSKIYDKIVEVTRRPDADKSKWFSFPWEKIISSSAFQGRLVFLENFDPSFTSREIEDLIYSVFKQPCSARVIQQGTFHSPNDGQAYVLFQTQAAADQAVQRIDEGCLMLPGGRPLLAGSGMLKLPSKSNAYIGHLCIDKHKLKQHREWKKAVATSHCSQPNTVEYVMAMEWMLIQERSACSLNRLNEKYVSIGDRGKSQLKLKF